MGYLYACSHPTWGTGRFKVGFTTAENPYKRIRQATTYLPDPIKHPIEFEVFYRTEGPPKFAEQSVKRNLSKYRVSWDPIREFFDCVIEQIRESMFRAIHFSSATKFSDGSPYTFYFIDDKPTVPPQFGTRERALEAVEAREDKKFSLWEYVRASPFTEHLPFRFVDHVDLPSGVRIPTDLTVHLWIRECKKAATKHKFRLYHQIMTINRTVFVSMDLLAMFHLTFPTTRDSISVVKEIGHAIDPFGRPFS
jgi:hypothetical protein